MNFGEELFTVIGIIIGASLAFIFQYYLNYREHKKGLRQSAYRCLRRLLDLHDYYKQSMSSNSKINKVKDNLNIALDNYLNHIDPKSRSGKRHYIISERIGEIMIKINSNNFYIKELNNIIKQLKVVLKVP